MIIGGKEVGCNISANNSFCVKKQETCAGALVAGVAYPLAFGGLMLLISAYKAFTGHRDNVEANDPEHEDEEEKKRKRLAKLLSGEPKGARKIAEDVYKFGKSVAEVNKDIVTKSFESLNTISSIEERHSRATNPFLRSKL